MKHRKILYRKYISYILSAAMVFSMLTGFTAAAAKKPSLNQKKLSLNEGTTKRIKIKNANKKAKITWKTSKKAIVKITKKKTKGKAAYADIKAVKKGKAVITAAYRLKGKTTSLKCKVTVTKFYSLPLLRIHPNPLKSRLLRLYRLKILWR